MLQHLFIPDRMGKVSLLQHLILGDVKNIKSGSHSLSKIKLVIDKVARLGAVVNVNTKPRTARAILTLYEATKTSIVTDMPSQD
eukprot:15328038-Ditylum_brightwellii.AAC.2